MCFCFSLSSHMCVCGGCACVFYHVFFQLHFCEVTESFTRCLFLLKTQKNQEMKAGSDLSGGAHPISRMEIPLKISDTKVIGSQALKYMPEVSWCQKIKCSVKYIDRKPLTGTSDLLAQFLGYFIYESKNSFTEPVSALV